MDAKDFIFPGVILGLVVIIGVGLLFTHSDGPQPLPSPVATSTQTDSTTTSTGTPSTVPPSTSGTDSSAHAYGSVTLGLGQAASFEDKTSIRPMHVLEDSRCPAGVQCIQAGTVKISLTAISNRRVTNETLSIGQSIHVGSDTITLDSVAPEKQKGGYPAPSSYRFTFTVTHG